MAVLFILLTWLVACSAQFHDEYQSFDPECLKEGVFHCLDESCVPQEYYCDGKYDCKDASDENFCSKCIIGYI